MRYLLDTNIVSDLVRNPQGRVADQIHRVGEVQVCTSIIVAAEIAARSGKTQVDAARAAARSDAGRARRPALATPADAAYAVIRSRLEQTGRPIGGNDPPIAAQAVALGHTIVTDNEGEFARVDGLRCENWLLSDRIWLTSSRASLGRRPDG